MILHQAEPERARRRQAERQKHGGTGQDGADEEGPRIAGQGQRRRVRLRGPLLAPLPQQTQEHDRNDNRRRRSCAGRQHQAGPPETGPGPAPSPGHGHQQEARQQEDGSQGIGLDHGKESGLVNADPDEYEGQQRRLASPASARQAPGQPGPGRGAEKTQHPREQPPAQDPETVHQRHRQDVDERQNGPLRGGKVHKGQATFRDRPGRVQVPAFILVQLAEPGTGGIQHERDGNGNEPQDGIGALHVTTRRCPSRTSTCAGLLTQAAPYGPPSPERNARAFRHRACS